jgi:hypothetical protein
LHNLEFHMFGSVYDTNLVICTDTQPQVYGCIHNQSRGCRWLSGLLFHSREVRSPKFSPETGYPDWVFCNFPHLLQTTAGTVSNWSYHHPFPINYSLVSHLSVLHNLNNKYGKTIQPISAIPVPTREPVQCTNRWGDSLHHTPQILSWNTGPDVGWPIFMALFNPSRKMLERYLILQHDHLTVNNMGHWKKERERERKKQQLICATPVFTAVKTVSLTSTHPIPGHSLYILSLHPFSILEYLLFTF